MDVAKHTDLLGLLPSLGYTLKRIGSYYTTAEMDSIRIRDPTRWKRYSTGQGGDAITFLQEFCGMRFPEAVDYLLAYHGRSRDSPDRNQPIPRPKLPPPREKPPFVLPPANPDQRRVFAYLRKRGIAPKVIRAFMEAGLLRFPHGRRRKAPAVFFPLPGHLFSLGCSALLLARILSAGFPFAGKGRILLQAQA